MDSDDPNFYAQRRRNFFDLLAKAPKGFELDPHDDFFAIDVYSRKPWHGNKKVGYLMLHCVRTDNERAYSGGLRLPNVYGYSQVVIKAASPREAVIKLIALWRFRA